MSREGERESLRSPGRAPGKKKRKKRRINSYFLSLSPSLSLSLCKPQSDEKQSLHCVCHLIFFACACNHTGSGKFYCFLSPLSLFYPLCKGKDFSTLLWLPILPQAFTCSFFSLTHFFVIFLFLFQTLYQPSFY